MYGFTYILNETVVVPAHYGFPQLNSWRKLPNSIGQPVVLHLATPELSTPNCSLSCERKGLLLGFGCGQRCVKHQQREGQRDLVLALREGCPPGVLSLWVAERSDVVDIWKLLTRGPGS